MALLKAMVSNSTTRLWIRTTGSLLNNELYAWKPIIMAVGSTASFRGRSSAGIVGSNPTGFLDVCLLQVLLVGRYRSLRLADQSSRGVLPSVVCPSVISKPQQREGLDRLGL
jgi:hypothetical protein